MNSTPAIQGGLLLNVARQAMTQNGLLPDFGDAALKQLASITAPASDSSPDIRDLRQLLWASIDNDNSRDLDQLSVADSSSPGATRFAGARSSFKRARASPPRGGPGGSPTSTG